MAWTSPRTYVAGETITAALLNTHVRDNLLDIGGTSSAWTSFTPTWFAGANVVACAVTALGRYKQHGKSVLVQTINVASAAVASGVWQLRSLPVPVRTIGSTTPLGAAYVQQATNSICVGYRAGANEAEFLAHGAGAGAGVTVAVAISNVLSTDFAYEAA